MEVYRRYILPYLIHGAMRRRDFGAFRERATASAAGRVLEVGIGSGLNLPLYGAGATAIVGLDSSRALLAMARRVTCQHTRPLTLIQGTAEAMPLFDRSVDTVVMTWTLCSIPDASHGLAEIRRVLKPSGRLVFIEHGLAPEPRVAWWQDRLTQPWKHISGGCHLNRPVKSLIENAGFRIEHLRTDYMKGPKPMSFMYEGSATPL